MQVSIPDTVTIIGPFAFENCTDITVTGAENVEEIQTGAFSKCGFAMPYPFSENLINIGSDAFLKAKGIRKLQLNENLKEIYIPRSVEIIENPIASRPQNGISIYIPAEAEVIERLESTNDIMVIYGIEKALFIVEKDSYAETYSKEMAENYGAKYKIMDKIEYPE